MSGEQTREQIAEVLAAPEVVEAAAKAHYEAWSLNTANREGWDDMAAHNRGMAVAVLTVAAAAVAAALPDPEQAEGFVKMRDAFKREHGWRREAEAQRDDLRAKVARVEALASAWEHQDRYFPSGPQYAVDLRAALDGAP